MKPALAQQPELVLKGPKMSAMLEAAARAVATANGFRYSGDSILENAEENPRAALFVAVARAVIDSVLPMERDAIIKIVESWGKRADMMTDTAFIPGASQGERFASNGIVDKILARNA